MQEINLSAGTIEYQDTGGSGPIVVLLHGVSMDSSVWRHVVADLLRTTDVWRPPSHWAPTACRCDLPPTCPSREWLGWWPSSWIVFICGT
jgi:pimeloyl-ACP methyl ester carboxylesterase